MQRTVGFYLEYRRKLYVRPVPLEAERRLMAKASGLTWVMLTNPTGMIVWLGLIAANVYYARLFELQEAGYR